MAYFVYLPGNFDVCLSMPVVLLPGTTSTSSTRRFEQSCNMRTEFQRSGIFDEVVQWRTLSTFLETLTFVSACRWFCFPELPRPPVPADEFEQFEQSCNMWTEFQRSGIFDEVAHVYLPGNFDVCLSMLVVLLPGTTSTSSTRR